MERIGVALSGGGARGSAHLGILQALLEAGIEVSAISGTSAGAIAAALFASGVEPVRILERIRSFKLLFSLRPAWVRSGLFSLDAVTDFLKDFIPHNDFARLKIPLSIAATNLSRGEVRYFNSGKISTAVGASCCVPGIFAPIQVEGDWYADGGIVDNLPVKPLKDSCDRIYGVHCNPVSRQFNDIKIRQVIERSLLLAIGNNIKESMGLCDFILEPPGLDKFSASDFSKAGDIYEIGYMYAQTKLKADPIHIA